MPGLRKRLRELQVTQLATVRELERTDRILKAQVNINRDLSLELEQLSSRAVADQSEMERKVRAFEQLAASRLDRINALEAEIKELRKSISSLERRSQQQQSADPATGRDDSEQEEADPFREGEPVGDASLQKEIVSIGSSYDPQSPCFFAR